MKEIHPDFARLYARIPAFTCSPDCKGACCGVLAMHNIEGEAIGARNTFPLFMGSVIAPPTDSGGCQFYSPDDGCKCYDKRPLLCRLFGVTRSLKCPHGGVAAAILSPDEEALINAEYRRLHIELSR